jgi:protein TonB
LTLNKFFFLSIVVHAIIGLCIYFIPGPEVKKPTEFAASLVSPEELAKPNIQAVPVLPKTPQKSRQRVKPLPPRVPERAPLHPAPPTKPLPPSLERPVVPGEGQATAKALPEGMHPLEGEAGRNGRSKAEDDAKDTRNAVERGKPGFSVARSLKEAGEAMAKKDSSGAGRRARKDDAATFDTDDYRYAGYMRLLRQKIESIWEYPPEEAASGHYGDLKIRFTIKKDGRLSEIEIVQHSGYPVLDKAAVKALRDGEPYWPLPDDWHMDSYTILGHFIYSLYGYRLR